MAWERVGLYHIHDFASHHGEAVDDCCVPAEGMGSSWADLYHHVGGVPETVIAK